MSKHKEMVDAQAKIWNQWSHVYPHLMPGWKLDFVLNENHRLKVHIKRLDGRCQALDDQVCNLLEICRQHGVDVSSQDIINGRRKAKEAKP